MATRIYLDHASLTPVDKAVQKRMAALLATEYANPSSFYKEGLEAKRVVRESRQEIATLLNIKPEEVVFVGSGTESDNLALIGVFNAWKDKLTPHIITTTIEHPGVLEACRWIETQGGEVTYVAPEANGIVQPGKIAAALKPNTVLVSVMLANNEIGTIQPLKNISRELAEVRKKQNALIPYLHTDASQAANYMDLSFQKLGVDMLTLDGAKIYGPRGTGILAVRRHVALAPLIHGGGQERGLRAGTENVPAIAGFALALRLAQERREAESARLAPLQKDFFERVIKHIPNVIINGDMDERLPNNINICIPGIDAEFAVIQLDQAGIACSAASSCQSLSENPYSYVVNELGEEGKKCRGSSLRFTMGQATRPKDLDLTLRKILSIITPQ